MKHNLDPRWGTTLALVQQAQAAMVAKDKDNDNMEENNADSKKIISGGRVADVLRDPYSGKILVARGTSTATENVHSTDHSDHGAGVDNRNIVYPFPAVQALPYVFRIAGVDYEGNLLYNPYNKREIFVVHNGMYNNIFYPTHNFSILSIHTNCRN